MALMVANIAYLEDPAAMSLALAKRLNIEPSRVLDICLVKKSLDARHRSQRWVAVFRVNVTDEASLLASNPASVHPWTSKHDARYGLVDQSPKKRLFPDGYRVIVVGGGPAGLFSALYLAESGASVVLFERGGPVEDRVPAVARFWRRKEPLDPENNILFGEGGAGTFSDGKIYTRRRDGELGYIFQRFVDFGADPEIRREAFAHLGTDRVRKLLPVFRARLIALGVEIRFHTRVDGLLVEEGRVNGVIVGERTERAAAVIVACGHSARDTNEALVKAGAEAVSRPIAIGLRIEHPQVLIDAGRYGRHPKKELPAASYRMADSPEGKRGVHSFCMCPGGMVVPASHQPGRVVVNGMSFSTRRARWANSAIIVQVTPEDYGGDGPLAGYRWQDAIEQRAYRAGGSDDSAPAQRFVDLVAGRLSQDLPKVSFPMGVKPASMREVLPDFIVDRLIEAIWAFDLQLPGFAGPEAILIAPESRTTSPIRFLRTDALQSTTLPGLYPVGEGAGYGGGIISSALDGVRAAEQIVRLGSCG